jgi:hypothetical protein
LLAPTICMMTNNEGEKDRDQEWSKLCELVAREKDPRKLSELVDQLLKKLDRRRQELRASDRPANPTKPNNS